jgi:hypothetical protein
MVMEVDFVIPMRVSLVVLIVTQTQIIHLVLLIVPEMFVIMVQTDALALVGNAHTLLKTARQTMDINVQEIT